MNLLVRIQLRNTILVWKIRDMQQKNDLIYRQITRHSDWTNKQLSIALDVSISTIKRKRKQSREFQKTGTGYRWNWWL
ncbi:hypothetical protein [Mycoplasmopsis opalescens]|uniref:hypothetical protein n=1 Tax=Mycoplasmopsis opalescens TaxID=114886 RepID=UPI0012EC56BA|nr:hypothetical protein [Mycoplasmopsis opalescens]